MSLFPSSTIAIVGQGYVGLPLSLIFAESGFKVIALDIDPAKISSLQAGRSYIKHISDQRIANALQGSMLAPTQMPSDVAQAEAIIICVPTPLDRYRQPDTSFVENTILAVKPYLRPNCLISIESTVYPGFTKEVAVPLLTQSTNRTIGKDLYLVFSPEREDPGNSASQVRKIPKLIGGITPACEEIGTALYRKAIETVVPVGGCSIAEAAKLTENIFRSVNIALVNELKTIFDPMGIDVWKVIEAAKTKPFGYMPFYPGPGLGGHCIPIDPFYLSWKAREFGISTRFIELAGEINHSMPDYVVEKLTTALNQRRCPIHGSRILIVGIAYKPNVDDMRESPALAIADRILQRQGEIAFYDPFIPSIPSSRQHPHLAGRQSISWTPADLREFDAAIIVTNHHSIDFEPLLQSIPCIVDTRNALAAYPSRPGQVTKA
ncbi:MAG: nucleotide sugar dehydrogenase [Puniceicoccaceae bacterium]